MNMQHRLTKTLPVVAVLMFVSVLFIMSGCSSSLELSSGWTNQEIAVTGDGSHWNNATIDITGPDVSVGVKNDGTNLYVGLITSNRATQLQLLALGCTAWFDTGGKKEKTFGIQFPISGLLQGRRFPSRENQEDFQRLLNAAQRQLTILGPGEGERRRMTVQDAAGVEAHLGYADGTLTYELKVPLQKTAARPYAINADMTKPLLIGFETGDLAEAMKGQPGVSSPSQSAGGRGRGGRGTGGAGGGGLGNEMPEPLKHWITVHLSNGTPAK
jgi:hypothetical protein